jgi:hypothetical protein
MYEQKTKPTATDITTYIKLNSPTEAIYKDAEILVQLMQKLTGKKPVLWGSSIIGFDQYDYQYASGHKGTSLKIGFSIRKDKFSIYSMGCTLEGNQHLEKLGKFKMGKACLYVKKLADIDLDVLATILQNSLNSHK